MIDSQPLPPCYRFRVSGRVQGVYFRQSSLRQAQDLGLCGWVRNTDQAQVEGEVSGGEDALATFRDWLRRGPTAARVDQLV